MTERTLRGDLSWALLLGSAAGLSVWLLPGRHAVYGLAAVGTVALLLPLSWWILSGAGRWVAAFLLAALLLPPLPFAWGDAGAHPAILIAGLGLCAGLVRMESWVLVRRPVSGALVLLLAALLLSIPAGVLYSGPGIAFGSLARLGLFAISAYLFLYLADGPGRALDPGGLIRLLFWAGSISALFACLDFYFQFPAPARFAEQFVWLPGGVYRRAQGVFYEASTLGLFCVFLLTLIASVAVLRLHRELRLPRLWLAAGAVAGLSALLLSFSRTALASLALSVGMLIWMEARRRGVIRKLLRLGALLLVTAIGGGAALYWFLPDFLAAALSRFWYSGMYLLEAPNLILSRRLDTWTFLLGRLEESPWHALVGIGYKTLPYTDYLGQRLPADNMYLSLLVETGLLGLGSLLVLHYAVLKTTYRIAASQRNAGGDVRRMLGLCMFCFWCGLALQMFSGDVLTYWRILPAFFAVLAVAVREPVHEDSVSRSVR